MSEPGRIACAACSHEIDAAAKLCPYCGADPRTGAKVVDTDAILHEMFPPKNAAKSESVIDYARQRQGIVAVLGAFIVILILVGLHQFVTRRNEAVNAANAVPLTDVADLNNQQNETSPQPMPDLAFQYDGRPQTMRTLIVEPGAVAPQQPAPTQTTTQ